MRTLPGEGRGGLAEDADGDAGVVASKVVGLLAADPAFTRSVCSGVQHLGRLGPEEPTLLGVSERRAQLRAERLERRDGKFEQVRWCLERHSWPLGLA